MPYQRPSEFKVWLLKDVITSSSGAITGASTVTQLIEFLIANDGRTHECPKCRNEADTESLGRYLAPFPDPENPGETILKYVICDNCQGMTETIFNTVVVPQPPIYYQEPDAPEPPDEGGEGEG